MRGLVSERESWVDTKVVNGIWKIGCYSIQVNALWYVQKWQKHSGTRIIRNYLDPT